MHRNFLVWTFIFFGFTSSAQNQRLLDSLLIGTRNAVSDSLKAEYHYELCYQWADFNFDSAMFHATRMSDIAKSSRDDLIKYQSYNAKGLAFDFSSKFDSAIYFYNLAGQLAFDIDYLKGQAVAKFNIGVVHFFAGEMELAVENYLLAEKIYLQQQDNRNLSRLYNNLGIIYRQTKKYDLAIEIYLKSIILKRELQDITGLMSTLTNLSAAYQYLEKYDQAIVASNEVIELALATNNKGSHLLEIMNLAKSYQAKGDVKKAFDLYKEAEKMLGEQDDYPFVIDIYQNLAEFYMLEADLGRAKNYLDLANQVLIHEHLDKAMNQYWLQSRYYRLTSQSDLAILAMEEVFKLQGQIFDNEVGERVTELEQLYEKEKREIQIEQLNTKNELQTLSIEKSNRERNGLIIFSILIIGVAVLIFRLYSQKKQSLTERETLLKEIHHRVKNNLQIISSLLNIQVAHLKDNAAKDAVREGQNRVKSMALIHEKLYRNDNLSGVSVDDYISNLVRNLFHSFGADEEKISLKLNVEPLKSDIATLIPLGLILNELITNALKYAFKEGRGAINLALSRDKGELHLQVKDDGVGMDETTLESTNSYGWKMIQSLSRKLGAKITIDSTEGTEIKLRIKNFILVS